MSCVNCEAERRAYTLRAHVEETDAAIELPFCSSDCLGEWI